MTDEKNRQQQQKL